MASLEEYLAANYGARPENGGKKDIKHKRKDKKKKKKTKHAQPDSLNTSDDNGQNSNKLINDGSGWTDMSSSNQNINKTNENESYRPKRRLGQRHDSDDSDDDDNNGTRRAINTTSNQTRRRSMDSDSDLEVERPRKRQKLMRRSNRLDTDSSDSDDNNLNNNNNINTTNINKINKANDSDSDLEVPRQKRPSNRSKQFSKHSKSNRKRHDSSDESDDNDNHSNKRVRGIAYDSSEDSDEDDDDINGGTVYRDSSGKKLSEKDKKRIKLEKDKEKIKEDRTIMEWSSGLVQKQENELIADQVLKQQFMGMARYRDDAELNEYKRQEYRIDDPLNQMPQSKKHKDKKDNKNDDDMNEDNNNNNIIERPMYQGNSWSNRFNILSGYRWDGVDRSNGFEKKKLAQESQLKDKKVKSYQWSVSDM